MVLSICKIDLKKENYLAHSQKFSHVAISSVCSSLTFLTYFDVF